MSNADPAALVQERINRLLTEVDPKNTKPEEFSGHRYELGLAWVQFPEGRGGLGIAPSFQRLVDEQLARAGAPPAGSRQFFGSTMAGPVMMTHGSEELLDRLLRPSFTGEVACRRTAAWPNGSSVSPGTYASTKTCPGRGSRASAMSRAWCHRRGAA